MTWEKHIPDSVIPLASVPLEFYQLAQANLPVMVKKVDLDSSAVVVLPAAFSAVIEDVSAGGIDDYMVAVFPQSLNPAMGKLVVEDANKSTTQFTITGDGSELTGKALALVFWTPGA